MAASHLKLAIFLSLLIILSSAIDMSIISSTKCDDYFSCPDKNTCCCLFVFGSYCFEWGCCPMESATCCDDNESCCPHDYPVCDLQDQTCLMSKGSPMGVPALKRFAAKSKLPSRLFGRKI